MKKFVVFLMCFLFSQGAFAGNQNLQMVLDKVHEQGFYGCDTAIDKFLPSWGDILYAQAQLSHIEKPITLRSSSGEEAFGLQATPTEEAIEIHFGTTDEVNGYLVRKINGVCYGWQQTSFREVGMSCAEVRRNNSAYEVAGHSGSASWMKMKSEKISRTVFIDAGGSCVLLNIDLRGILLGVKMDPKKQPNY